ncbi:MAG: asparagine synthase (glutamine-hydrolyzing) [Geminicoccaceae bacterium]
MCGIAGLVCFDPSCSGAQHEALVERMCDLQVHRGPDDGGIACHGHVGLGARRLSIIDLSPAGHMPMSDESGRWWITYNGEVYNFEELRAELLERDHRFRSRTDTEVILHAYIEWGQACLERFVGMFAFAIFDAQSGEVVLVRDRYGIKPLYYAKSRGHLLFSSEIKALIPLLERRAVDRQGLMEWWLYRNVDALTAPTLLEGVCSVLPGQLVRIRGGEITVEEYYSQTRHLSADRYGHFASLRVEDIVDEVDARLNEATRLRLVSDVPVGTLLSGGLDSSLITSIAAKYTRDLTAFHVSVEGFPSLDERRHAEELTARFGLPMVPFSLTGETFRRALPRVIYFSDLPLTHPNSVAYHLICEVARQHGVIVLLSGEGADELFGGYSWNYRRKRWLMRMQPVLRCIPAKLYDIMALLVYHDANMPIGSHRFREALPPAVGMIDRYARLDWAERCEQAYDFVPARQDRVILGSMLADLSDFLAPLLRRLDRMSMGASVECRVPFLDHRLVHEAINLPLDYRIGRHADKWILKQVAARYFSGRLITRRKMGFPLPLEDYLRPLANKSFFAGGFCEQTLGLSRRGIERLVLSRQRWSHGVFGLVTLEIWGRLFLMGHTVEQVSERIERVEHESAGTGRR